MIGSLFDKKLEKKFDTIEKAKAKMQKQELAVQKEALDSVDPKDIRRILDLVAAEGHPDHQRVSDTLRDKYEHHSLEFDDLNALRILYKSYWPKFQNKEAQHE